MILRLLSFSFHITLLLSVTGRTRRVVGLRPDTPSLSVRGRTRHTAFDRLVVDLLASFNHLHPLVSLLSFVDIIVKHTVGYWPNMPSLLLYFVPPYTLRLQSQHLFLLVSSFIYTYSFIRHTPLLNRSSVTLSPSVLVDCQINTPRAPLL